MARSLENYTASGQIRSGPVAAVADTSAPYRALGSVAHGLDQVAGAASQIAANRQTEQDTRQASDAYEAFQRESIQWHQDNQGREDYGQAFREFADKRIGEIQSTLSTSVAQQHFKHSASQSANTQWNSALKTGEETRFQNYKVGESKRSATSLDLARTISQQDPDKAGSLLRYDLANQRAGIEQAYGKTAPAIANKLITDAVADTVIGASEFDPALAKTILDDYPQVDARIRSSLLAQIEQSQRGNQAVARVTLQNTIADSISNAERLKSPAPEIAEAEFVNAFGSEEVGKAQKIEYDRKRQMANGVYDFYQATKGRNLEAINKAEVAANSGSGEVGAYVAEVSSKGAQHLRKKMAEDPASYARENPFVSKLFRLASNAPENMREMFRQRAYDMQIQYMGHAPQGTPATEAGWYLGLDSHEVSLMPKVEAESWAGKMNNGKPSERQQALQQFEETFKNHRDIAWSDLNKLPAGKRISPEMQLAALNRFSPELPQYLSALSNNDALKGLKKEDLKDMDAALFSLPNWKAFRDSYVGDNNQNASAIEGFQNGISAYALSLPQGTIQQRMQTAFDTLIGRNFGFVQLKDQKLAIAKYKNAGEAFRSDEEVALIGSKISEMVRNVDPSMLDTSNASMLPQLSSEGREKVMETYLNGAMVVPSPDGQSAMLYFRRQDGIPVQMRDNQKRPIIYHFDDPSKTNWPISPKVAERFERQKKALEALPDISFPDAMR